MGWNTEMYAFLALISAVSVQSPIPTGSPGSGLELALARAGERRGAWEDALERVTDSERAGLSFLIEHMPDSDLRNLSADLVVENVRLAYEIRREVPWGARLPEAIFLNDVLPYANISEKRDAWRPSFVQRFLPMVAECKTPGEAAQVLNRRIFPELGVRYSTERRAADQGPFETMESGIASCTGLSILLTDACRAVGVPARLAGIPSWTNKNGNHTWVEVWDGGWHFTGAAEPSAEGLDRAWFVADARLAIPGSEDHAIYALSWARTGMHFPTTFAEGAELSNAVDVTSRYAGEALAEGLCRLMVEVRSEGKRVAVPVRVTSSGESPRVFEGLSRDEGADTNDLLALVVASNGKYRVTATGSDWSVEEDIAIEPGQSQVVVRLER